LIAHKGGAWLAFGFENTLLITKVNVQGREGKDERRTIFIGFN
jgi:hypothetical protein